MGGYACQRGYLSIYSIWYAQSSLSLSLFLFLFFLLQEHLHLRMSFFHLSLSFWAINNVIFAKINSKAMHFASVILMFSLSQMAIFP